MANKEAVITFCQGDCQEASSEARHGEAPTEGPLGCAAQAAKECATAAAAAKEAHKGQEVSEPCDAMYDRFKRWRYGAVDELGVGW